MVDEDPANGRCRLFDQRLANDFATEITAEAIAVENLLNLIRLHGARQAEFEWPAPKIGDEIAADKAAGLFRDRQETQILRRGRQKRVLSGRSGTRGTW